MGCAQARLTDPCSARRIRAVGLLGPKRSNEGETCRTGFERSSCPWRCSRSSRRPVVTAAVYRRGRESGTGVHQRSEGRGFSRRRWPRRQVLQRRGEGRPRQGDRRRARLRGEHEVPRIERRGLEPRREHDQPRRRRVQPGLGERVRVLRRHREDRPGLSRCRVRRAGRLRALPVREWRRWYGQREQERPRCHLRGEHGSYLVGIAAAMTTKTGKVGFLGGQEGTGSHREVPGRLRSGCRVGGFDHRGPRRVHRRLNRRVRGPNER